MEVFSPDLIAKKRVIIGTKLDLESDIQEDGLSVREKLAKLKKKYKREQVLGISVFSGEGIKELASLFASLVEEASQ